MIFSGPYPTFQLVSDPTPDPLLDPTWFFSNILDINFTIFFLHCKCVRLLIGTRNKPFRRIFFWQNGIYIFKSVFLLRNCQILPVFHSSFTSYSFPIRSCSDSEWLFSGSGSKTLKIVMGFFFCRAELGKDGWAAERSGGGASGARHQVPHQSDGGFWQAGPASHPASGAQQPPGCGHLETGTRQSRPSLR